MAPSRVVTQETSEEVSMPAYHIIHRRKITDAGASKRFAKRIRPWISSRSKARLAEPAASTRLTHGSPGAEPGSAALCGRVLDEHWRLQLPSIGVTRPLGVGVAAAGLITPPVAARMGAGAQGGGNRKSGAFIGGLGSCGPDDGLVFGDCATAAVTQPKHASARTRARFMIALLPFERWRAERFAGWRAQPGSTFGKVM
jgi:hypothetical protein